MPLRSSGVLAVFLLLACQPKKPSALHDDANDGIAPVASASAPGAVEAPPTYDTSCTQDSDCTPAPGCCPVPCTGRVVNQKALPAVRAYNEKNCPKDRACVSAGGCRTHAYLCVKKTCALVYSDSPDYRPRQ